MKNLKDIAFQSHNEWRRFNDQRKKKFRGLKTGIEGLDRQLLGLTGLVGIQGEPKSCKSTLALQVAIHNAATGVPVLVVDRENGSGRLRRRCLSNYFGISQKEVDEASDEVMRGWYEQLAPLSLFVDHDPCTVDDVRSYLAEMSQAFPEKPMLLVVDSLQALGSFNGQDERMSLQSWLQELDQLKLDYRDRLVVLLTIEKKVGSFGEASKEAGKGTGAIGYKCELLFDMREDPKSGLLFLDLVANRDGATFSNNSLRKVLKTADPNSFIFRLEHAGSGTKNEF